MSILNSKIDSKEYHWHFLRACHDHQQGDQDMKWSGILAFFSVQEFIFCAWYHPVGGS
jgi:hypothetical protein